MKLITRWNALHGKMLDDILARGCEQCERLWTGNDYARLMRWCVGRDAAGHEIWQRRVVCIGCHARLGNPMKAADHPRWQQYPVYDAAYERLTEAVARGEISPEPLGVLPEEVAEIALAARPVGLEELIAAVLRGEWPLERAREEFVAHGVTLGFCDVDTDVVELAHRLGPGSYAALMFQDGARLLRFDHGQLKVLKPHRARRAARPERRLDDNDQPRRGRAMTTIATAVLTKALIAPLTAIGALGHAEHAGIGRMASAGFIATPAQLEPEQA